MTNDTRLGLPLSLVEALRADPSPTAAKLADLLEQDEPPRRSIVSAREQAQPWQAVLTGLGLSVGLGAQSYAAAQPAGLPDRDGRRFRSVRSELAPAGLACRPCESQPASCRAA